jgi:hypothetical protein
MKNSGFVVLAGRSISVSLTIFSENTEEGKSQSYAGNTSWLKDRAKRLVSVAWASFFYSSPIGTVGTVGTVVIVGTRKLLIW